MIEYTRRPEEVVGCDPTMLGYWDQMPDQARRYLLASPIQIATLGELELMNEQLQFLTREPPAVF